MITLMQHPPTPFIISSTESSMSFWSARERGSSSFSYTGLSLLFGKKNWGVWPPRPLPLLRQWYKHLEDLPDTLVYHSRIFDRQSRIQILQTQITLRP